MMYLVQFEDGSTTFVFPDEVEIISDSGRERRAMRLLNAF
jgi:hypothetical protein